MPTIQEFSTKDRIELSSLVLNTTTELIDNSDTLLQMLDAGSSVGSAMKAVKAMKFLSKASVFLGAAGAALDIVMMFMPSEADEVIGQIEILQNKLDTVFTRLNNDLENKYREIMDTVQYSGFDDARTRIAHAEHIIDNYMANYASLFNGFISAKNNVGKNVIKSIYNNRAFLSQWSIELNNSFFQGSNDLSKYNALKGLQPTYFVHGVNTFYIRCSSSDSSKGFFGAINSFNDGPRNSWDKNVVDNLISKYATGDASWQVLGSNEPMSIELAFNSDKWETPLPVSMNNVQWTAPTNDFQPAIENANWIWADAKYNNVWLKCTFYYNQLAYNYFMQSPNAYNIQSGITCNGTIKEMYVYSEDFGNLFPCVELQPTNLRYQSFRLRPTFMTSYIDQSDAVAYNKLSAEEQQLQVNIKKQVTSSLLPNNGRNTLYIQCQNDDANTDASLLASFSTFISSDVTNIWEMYKSTQTIDKDSFKIQTNNSGGQLFVLETTTEMNFEDVLKATSWKRATEYTAATNKSIPAVADNKPTERLPESNAKWVWTSNPKAKYVWFMWRYEYSASAHQKIEKYFRQISKSNIENFITDDLADSIIGIYVNFLNLDDSRKEGVLDMIFKQTFASREKIELLAVQYMQLIQRGVKALTFLRVMREQILYLKEKNVDKVYDLTASDQKLLDKKMNHAQFGVTELINSSINQFNLSDLFDARLSDVLTKCNKREYFEPEATRFIEKYIIENEILINNTIDKKTKSEGGAYSDNYDLNDDIDINTSLAHLILSELNNQYSADSITWAVIVFDDWKYADHYKKFSSWFGFGSSASGVLCCKVFTGIKERFLFVVARDVDKKRIGAGMISQIKTDFKNDSNSWSKSDYMGKIVPNDAGAALFWYCQPKVGLQVSAYWPKLNPCFETNEQFRLYKENLERYRDHDKEYFIFIIS